jgi:hypothetical protein
VMIVAANPAVALAVLGSVGVLAVIASANMLAKPGLHGGFAWALAVPELALLAAAKYGLLAVLR